MSENNFPEKIQEVVSEVADKVADKVEALSDKAGELVDRAAVSEKAEAVGDKLEDLSGKSLAELSDLFVKLKTGADSMMRSKEAEAIKSAFYKLLLRLKGDDASTGSLDNPFEAVEQNFKAMYADYKKERAEFNRRQD